MVLDVGCAPGAWLQTLFRSNTQRPSFIVGVDMQRVDSRVIQELQVEETNISGGAIYASGGGGGGGGGEGIDTRGIALVQRRLGDNHKEDVQVLTAALRIASGGAVRRFNTILSDLAPKTTGYGDGLASVEAASIAARLATADKYDAYGADNDDDHHHEDDVQGSDADDTSASFQLLVPGGNICLKVLDGGTLSRGLEIFLRERFQTVQRYTPQASARSRTEQYIIARGFKGSPR